MAPVGQTITQGAFPQLKQEMVYVKTTLTNIPFFSRNQLDYASIIGFAGDNANNGRNYKYGFHDSKKHLVKTVKDPEGRDVLEYEYDGLNRLKKETRNIHEGNALKQKSSREYIYDLNNNLRFIDDGKGGKTEYIYDNKDRLTDIKYPGKENTLHWEYQP
ncbi:MAG: RHS repeat protein, partial [bacterium]|nr:RHS repeat protein [bacterium]